MAFTASVTKQLGELLQEQQEPFVLEIYLIDKGYRKNMLNSKKGTRNRFFKRPSRSEALFRRKIISSCSSAVKALLDILKEKRSAFLRKGQHKLGNLLGEEEADRDIKMKKISEDRTQLSPISVLEATLSNEGSPVHARKTSEVNKHDSYSQYTKVKLALQQMKQLMFDYVKEIVETQRLKNKSQSQFREPMGAEAIGKILCENILGWSAQSTHKNYSNQLLHTDILDSAEEWNDFQQGKGIGLEIADYILEDIISSDIVMDMIRL